MFIRNCLTERNLLTVALDSETIGQVLLKMDFHLSLPCVSSNDSFLGLVSKRRIFENFQKAAAQGETYEVFLGRSITTCIDATVPTLTQDSFFEQTIEIIIRYPFVPIVENSKFIGIVKRGDVNGALSIAFATNVESDRILVGMAEVEGALQRLFTITHKLSLNVITAVSFDAGDKAINRRLILKVSKSNKLELLTQQLERAGFLIIEIN